MKLVVLQPGYLPWLGYFDQLRRSDLFVLYDDVQFDKGGWRNRNRIRTADPRGWTWLTVPVRTAGRFGSAITEMEIDGEAWAAKHWKTIVQAYRNAPCFDRHASAFEEVFSRPWRKLVDLDLALAGILAGAFGLGDRRVVRASTIAELPRALAASERLVWLCRHFGATHYFSGAASRAYLELERFAEHGIEVEFQDYVHPVYPQVYPGFVSHLSAIDALFNVGRLP